MQGLPVTIRLLDPPLHEVLPNLPDLRAQVERARAEEHDDLPELERSLGRVEEITRGPDARHPWLPPGNSLSGDL